MATLTNVSTMGLFQNIPFTEKRGRCNKKHYRGRCRVGPTGKKQWMIRVDGCHNCGVILPAQKLTTNQKNWVKRWNNRIKPLEEK